jgi:hypothetical protein
MCKNGLSMKNIAFFCFFLLAFSAQSTNFVADSLPGTLLQHGTGITFELQKKILTKDVQEGHLVPVVVTQDVVVADQKGQRWVVIRAGQSGQAVVERVQRRGMFGQPGAVTIRVVNVKTLDDTVIPVEGTPLTVRGHGRRGFAWSASIILLVAGVALGAPWLLPFGAAGVFIKGKNAEMKFATPLHGYVTEDKRVFKAAK